jgi:putative addiction module component (TIGR02574 family)
MTEEAFEQWKTQFQQLSPSERAELVHFLLVSLEPEDEGAAEAWDAEVARRVAEIRAGRATGILQGMEATAQQPQRSIDVTGLPEGAVRAVESLVSLLRPRPGPGGPAASSPDEWAKAIRAWAESHELPGTSADWSRESIYTGRGE